MICPKCKEVIDELEYDVTATCRSILNLGEECDKTYDLDALQGNVEFDNFACPLCNETLAFSEEEATNLLNSQ